MQWNVLLSYWFFVGGMQMSQNTAMAVWKGAFQKSMLGDTLIGQIRRICTDFLNIFFVVCNFKILWKYPLR